MNKLSTYVLLVASVSLLFVGCSNKNSNEACLHEVTMNLDKGNYNAVLASSCANDMDKAAANFGLAGFDIKTVINKFSETGSTTSSSATSTGSDLSTYMTALVSDTSGTSLTYLDNAITLYSKVTTTVPRNDCKDAPTRGYTVDNCKDAQFYTSLVSAVQALSLINVVLPNISIVNPDGSLSLNTGCDKNSNGVPDDADATACALIVSAATFTTGTIPSVQSITSCPTNTTAPYATVTHSPSLVFSSVTGTTKFDGLTITMQGNGMVSSCTPTPNTVTYKRLLYQTTAAGQYTSATTDANHFCAADDGTQWPCPIAQNGQPLDRVTAIDQTLVTSVGALSSSLSGTQASDVNTAVTNIQAQACCGCTTTPCTPCSTACSSQTIADYLQNNLH